MQSTEKAGRSPEEPFAVRRNVELDRGHSEPMVRVVAPLGTQEEEGSAEASA